MIVVMRSNATTREVSDVIARIRAMGYDVHLSEGKERTIIGVIGRGDPLNRDQLGLLPGVADVVPVSHPYKIASREFHPDDTLVPLNGIEVGGPNLAIIAGSGPPVYPGVSGHAPDPVEARSDAQAIGRSMAELRKLVPDPGSYVLESNYFEPKWQRAFWGANYPRLRAIKLRYDPTGLFFVHHGVGSEEWSADGWTRRAGL